MKILLVKDHVTLAEMSCSQLVIVRHEVLQVADRGERAVAMVPFQPDLVLLGIPLPDMTGYVADQLRSDLNGITFRDTANLCSFAPR